MGFDKDDRPDWYNPEDYVTVSVELPFHNHTWDLLKSNARYRGQTPSEYILESVNLRVHQSLWIENTKRQANSHTREENKNGKTRGNALA